MTAEEVKAFNETKLKAEKGDAKAQTSLAFFYRIGRGVAKDDFEAAKWNLKSAKQGNITAQFATGNYYTQGIGVQKDLAEGIKWYRKAAEQGDVLSQWALGNSYRFGDGVTKDEIEAYAWFMTAGNFPMALYGRAAIEKSLSPQQIQSGQKRSKELLALIEKNKAAAGTK
jgi:TPR repeat protein